VDVTAEPSPSEKKVKRGRLVSSVATSRAGRKTKKLTQNLRHDSVSIEFSRCSILMRDSILCCSEDLELSEESVGWSEMSEEEREVRKALPLERSDKIELTGYNAELFGW